MAKPVHSALLARNLTKIVTIYFPQAFGNRNQTRLVAAFI
jgi:hypothetical protein